MTRTLFDHPGTGEEVWHQTRGRIHAFVSGAGTGGTIAGVSAYLKQQDPRVQVFLVDPPGSSLFNKVGRWQLCPTLQEQQWHAARVACPLCACSFCYLLLVARVTLTVSWHADRALLV